MLPDRVSSQVPYRLHYAAPPLKPPQKSVLFSLEGKTHLSAELPKTKIFVVILEAEGPVL